MAFTSPSLLAGLQGTSESSSNSLTGGSGTITANRLLLVFVYFDNISTTDGNTNNCTSVTDSIGGNTYTKIYEQTNTVGGAAGDGAACAAFMCKVANGGTGTVTANFSANVTAKCLLVLEYQIDSSKDPTLDGSVQVLNNDNSDAGSMSISGLTSREHLFIRLFASETDVSGFTQTSLWDSSGQVNSGTGGSEKNHISGAYERRVETGTSKTSDPSCTDTTADRASIMFALYEATAAVPTTGGSFFRLWGRM